MPPQRGSSVVPGRVLGAATFHVGDQERDAIQVPGYDRATFRNIASDAGVDTADTVLFGRKTYDSWRNSEQLSSTRPHTGG